MEIIILRHGKSKLPSMKNCTARSFSEWVNNYNQSRLHTESTPTAEAYMLAERCQAVVTSTLRRSIDSAQILNTNKLLLTSANFNEAELPIIGWRYLKLSPKIWAFIFRILWFLGYSSDQESFKSAKKRACVAIDQLVELTIIHKQVLLIGHGIFNQILVNELRSRGWSGPIRASTKHWSSSIYKYDLSKFLRSS